MEQFSYVIALEDTEERVDKWISDTLPDISRSYIQKLIKDQLVFVNRVPCKANYRLKLNDEILFQIPQAVEPEILPEDLKLDILYEDEDVLVVNKPKNMVVHPAPGHYSGTLVNGVLYHCHGQLSGINGVLRPGIVHRIDKDTTGSVIICKNDIAHRSIAEQLKNHSIVRRYHAIVTGNLKDDEGTIEGPIGRHPTDRKKMAIHSKNGKPAITHYKVIERLRGYTYVECALETGRTHQIRVHMQSIGHPLLGDTVYGTEKQPYKTDGQVLHAKVLGFMHPVTGEYIETNAPLPLYFQNLLQKLSN